MTGARLLPWIARLAAGVLLAAPGASAASADAETPSGEAVCPVCALREGTRVPEPVRATREIDGIRYGFCSTACATEFDLNPDHYREVGAGADSFHVAPLLDFGAARAATAPT